MERSPFVFVSLGNPECSAVFAAKAEPGSAPAATIAPPPINNSRRVRLVIGTLLLSRRLLCSYVSRSQSERQSSVQTPPTTVRPSPWQWLLAQPISVARLERETGRLLRPRRKCPFARNSPSVTALHLHKRQCSRHGLVPCLKVVSTQDNIASPDDPGRIECCSSFGDAIVVPLVSQFTNPETQF